VGIASLKIFIDGAQVASGTASPLRLNCLMTSHKKSPPV
jgi:hypothetical protein